MSGEVSSPLPVSRGATGDILSPQSSDLSLGASPLSQTIVLESSSSGAPLLGFSRSEIEPAAEPPGSIPPHRSTRLQTLTERVSMLEKELVESEQTHKLRCRNAMHMRI